MTTETIEYVPVEQVCAWVAENVKPIPLPGMGAQFEIDMVLAERKNELQFVTPEEFGRMKTVPWYHCQDRLVTNLKPHRWKVRGKNIKPNGFIGEWLHDWLGGHEPDAVFFKWTNDPDWWEGCVLPPMTGGRFNTKMDVKMSTVHKLVANQGARVFRNKKYAGHWIDPISKALRKA